MDGTIKVDESFLDLSFKGNHIFDRSKMPRELHLRRHTSVQRDHSLHKVCVISAIDSENDLNTVVSNLGVACVSDIIGTIG